MCGGGYCIRHGDYRGAKKLMDEIIKLIREWIIQRRTGQISLNFYQGGISSINKIQTEKLDDSKRNDLLRKKKIDNP